jgi:hypothetical protein
LQRWHQPIGTKGKNWPRKRQRPTKLMITKSIANEPNTIQASPGVEIPGVTQIVVVGCRGCRGGLGRHLHDLKSCSGVERGRLEFIIHTIAGRNALNLQAGAH